MSLTVLSSPHRIVTGNNTNNKSESDQEDNDDVNDNDWSYGAEKKGKGLTFTLLFMVIWVLFSRQKMSANVVKQKGTT